MTRRGADRTDGTVSPEQQKKMTGLEFVQGLADGTLPLNTIAETLGYDIAEAECGHVVVTAEAQDTHLLLGRYMAASLPRCWIVAWASPKSMLGKGSASTTLEFKIVSVRPITSESGLIKAVGTIINCGRRTGTAEGRITAGAGRLLAHGTTTCLIFDR